MPSPLALSLQGGVDERMGNYEAGHQDVSFSFAVPSRGSYFDGRPEAWGHDGGYGPPRTSDPDFDSRWYGDGVEQHRMDDVGQPWTEETFQSPSASHSPGQGVQGTADDQRWGVQFSIPKYSKRLPRGAGSRAMSEDASSPSSVSEISRRRRSRSPGQQPVVSRFFVDPPWVPAGPTDDLTRTPMMPRTIRSSSSHRGRSPAEACRDLYADAAARRQRAEELRQTVIAKAEEAEEAAVSTAVRSRRAHINMYTLKDTRTREERDAELHQARMARAKLAEASKAQREENELRQCTFKPRILTTWKSPRADPTDRRLPQSIQGAVARQREVAAVVAKVDAETAGLDDEMDKLFKAAYSRIQQEETKRVSEFLRSPTGYTFFEEPCAEADERRGGRCRAGAGDDHRGAGCKQPDQGTSRGGLGDAAAQTITRVRAIFEAPPCIARVRAPGVHCSEVDEREQFWGV
mmetsp:Transcript_51328/g.135247  ORF Transcript_51328/g.135247 Transcript_51328/m.135247 type:complete len:462 (+) Transcript_51328:45-1430(+)